MAAMPTFTAFTSMHLSPPTSPSFPSLPSRGPLPRTTAFYGPAVVRAAFVIALFGWGVGFYGPPVFLYAVVARTGWPLAWVSAAVTLHFLWGAAVVACLPWIHRRVGIAAATAGGAMALALGAMGWAVASQPWQLALASLLTGGGWVPLGAAGINAIVSPWFARQRPMALAKAYNGASLGGMLLSPLWVALIGAFGFVAAAATVGLALLAVVLPLAWRVLPQTPASRDEVVDGGPGDATAPAPVAQGVHGAPPVRLWRDRAFATLAAAMALSLFAQIGLVAQLLSLLAPAMGAQAAGWMMALATGCGMGGRLLMARLLGPATDRRVAASAGYAIQALGTLALLAAAPGQWLLIVPGVVLFGLGIGNATSLPPLIAQAEFAPEVVPRVVARCVALSQGLYAFAPALLALLLVPGAGGVAVSLGVGTQTFFGVVLGIQGLAIACMLAGRK